MAGLISEATKERVRAASDIVEIIGGYLPLKRAGANFVALCPFHKEKSPSFNVNPHRQIFHCFGCHKGGDVFTFVQEYENIGFNDAVRRLAERAKIPLEADNRPGEQQARHIKDQLLQIHDQVAQRWQNCLANEAAGEAAREYLKKRGVSEEAIKLFRIGAAPEAWDDTVNWAKGKGYDLGVMETAGLIIRKEGTDRHYDRFRGRLMFPICDEQGRVIGFSGRVLSGDEKTAKYVNSPETPIFTKSKVFFGLDKSKRAILDAGYAIICEGQLDLIACFTAGVQNIVAPQGTAFTDQHARIIKRYVDEVVLCFDSDEAGQNAAVRSLDHLLASGLAIRVAVVPAPHDPDSYIKAHGGEAFRQLIEKADGYFDYYLNRLCALNDISTDKGRIIVVRQMLEALQKTGNVVLFEKYAQKTAIQLTVPLSSVTTEFKKMLESKEAREETKNEPEEFPEIELSFQDRWLLRLFLYSDEVLDASRGANPDWIQNTQVREIVRKVINTYESGRWKGLIQFLDDCESPALKMLITEATAGKYDFQNPTQQINDLLIRLRNQFIDRQAAILGQRANQPGVTDAERAELMRQQLELRAQKSQPIQPGSGQSRQS